MTSVLYSDSRYGPMYAEEAMATLQNANYWCNDDGTEVFDINGFRITQTADGLVKYVLVVLDAIAPIRSIYRPIAFLG